jgi:hypothetical protein
MSGCRLMSYVPKELVCDHYFLPSRNTGVETESIRGVPRYYRILHYCTRDLDLASIDRYTCRQIHSGYNRLYSLQIVDQIMAICQGSPDACFFLFP